MSKNKRNLKIYMFLMLGVGLGIALGILLGILLFVKWEGARREPVYRYVSMSEEAAARAYIWLDQIEDMPLDYAQIRNIMGDIGLTVVLTPIKESGFYAQTLAEGTYAECRKQAEEGLERAYREVLRYRLSAVGTEGDITDERMDELMREAYGVSVAEYLAGCGIPLIPGLEELMERYSGEVAYE